MRKPTVKLLSSLLALTLVGSLAAGCGQASPAASSTPASASVSASASESAASTESAPASAVAKTYDKTITIDNFNSQANYQGVQSGWFAKVVKDKFNMEINIIAPNVAGGGDTLFQTRSAAGNLGDLVMIGSENGRLADTVPLNLAGRSGGGGENDVPFPGGFIPAGAGGAIALSQVVDGGDAIDQHHQHNIAQS